MKERLEQIQTRIDAMTLRERGMVFFAIAGVLYLFSQVWLFDPLEARQKQELARLHQLQEEIATLQEQARELLAQRTIDPDAENRLLAGQLNQQITLVDRQIGDAVQGLIPPQQMARMLEQVLERQDRLTLLAVENLPPQPLIQPAPEQELKPSETVTAGIYRHRVKLRFAGDYLATLDYLRKIQQLGWPLYWDELEISADPYPKVTITLVVSTLSLEEGWIGV